MYNMIVDSMWKQNVNFFFEEDIQIFVITRRQDRDWVDIFALSIKFKLFLSNNNDQMKFLFHLSRNWEVISIIIIDFDVYMRRKTLFFLIELRDCYKRLWKTWLDEIQKDVDFVQDETEHFKVLKTRNTIKVSSSQLDDVELYRKSIDLTRSSFDKDS